MTESKTKAAAETPEKGKAPASTPEATTAALQTPEAARDVVAAVSRRADGTPDQTPGYVVIGEADDVTATDED